ncbi:FAD-dependent monooxygenase [Microtetraspora fusca]|uniref:FAD-dependent monooxygenase n=1 Tax=Microtetraspora fusca TaxID=1997 RepID=A0ABW6VCV6_MICFU
MDNLTPVLETEVLIVGAGPAGATAAALLATYGIRNVMINKYAGVSNTPRAHITNQRGVEVLRDLGLEQQVIAGATPQHLMGEHVYATSLSGRELGRLRTWYTHPHFKAEHDLASPCSVCDLPQHILEPILVDAASSRGSSVRFNTELVTFTQDEDGVTALVRDRLTGQEYGIRGKYLIGADGGRSVVAEKLGLPMVGEMGTGGSINVVFEADLTRFVEHRPGDMYWLVQPGVGHDGNGIGVLRMVRPWTRWVGVWGYDESQGTRTFTEEDGIRIAHQLIGDDTVPVKVLSISTWAVNDVYATDNMRGRVICVGDAVHRHSPMNGLGSNTSAAVVPDGTPEVPAPRDEEVYYFRTTRPGRHLPHVWVTRDQRRVSTFDLCGRGEFTLLTGIGGAAWRAAAEAVAARFGLPIRVHGIGRGCDYEDSYGDYRAASEVGEDGVLLVRPDHMVGWRAASLPSDPEAALGGALAKILGRADSAV